MRKGKGGRGQQFSPKEKALHCTVVWLWCVAVRYRGTRRNRLNQHELDRHALIQREVPGWREAERPGTAAVIPLLVCVCVRVLQEVMLLIPGLLVL